jgi:hypothetical protein
MLLTICLNRAPFRTPPPPLTSMATGTWTTTGSLSTPRGYHHTATLLSDGKVLVAAGSNTAGGDVLDEAELYDPATGTMRRKTKP